MNVIFIILSLFLFPSFGVMRATPSDSHISGLLSQSDEEDFGKAVGAWTELIGALEEERIITVNSWLSRPVKIWAHRGYMAKFPQNTIYAFKHASAVVTPRETVIETDIQMTSDGYPVLFHDKTLDEITDCTGAVASHTWSEIQACKIDNPGVSVAGLGADATKIPLFTDLAVIAKKAKAPIAVELKGMRSVADIAIVMDTATNEGVSGLVTWQCNYVAHCEAVRASDPTARLVYLGTASTLEKIMAEIDTAASFKGEVAYLTTIGKFAANPSIVSYAYSKNVDVTAFAAQTTENITTIIGIGVRNVYSDIPYEGVNWSGLTGNVVAKTVLVAFSGIRSISPSVLWYKTQTGPKRRA